MNREELMKNIYSSIEMRGNAIHIAAVIDRLKVEDLNEDDFEAVISVRNFLNELITSVDSVEEALESSVEAILAARKLK